MKWSWKVGQLSGIDVRIHATFVLLLGWVGASHWFAGRTSTAVLAGLAFIIALFGCVLLHELGHALAARRFGIATRDITLLPIGGVAHLERMPEKPAQELWVALAGPAVNVAIAAVLSIWLTVTHGWAPFGQLSITGGPFVERLLVANVTLVLFNLVPAFPMDGGRVLRALLAFRMPHARATQLAARAGQGIAVLFGVAGLFGNPMLVLIAVFVWLGAAQESAAAQMKAALAGVPVRAAMLTDFRSVMPADGLGYAVRIGLDSSQHDLPVVERGRVAGILQRADLLAALARHGSQHPVGEVMRRDFVTAESDETLDQAFERLQQCDCHTMPVMESGRLAGLLTLDKLGEFFLVQAAMQDRALAPRRRMGGTRESVEASS